MYLLTKPNFFMKTSHRLKLDIMFLRVIKLRFIRASVDMINFHSTCKVA